jgi:hypothetical protein
MRALTLNPLLGPSLPLRGVGTRRSWTSCLASCLLVPGTGPASSWDLSNSCIGIILVPIVRCCDLFYARLFSRKSCLPEACMPSPGLRVSVLAPPSFRVHGVQPPWPTAAQATGCLQLLRLPARFLRACGSRHTPIGTPPSRSSRLYPVSLQYTASAVPTDFLLIFGCCHQNCWIYTAPAHVIRKISYPIHICYHTFCYDIIEVSTFKYTQYHMILYTRSYV